MNKKLRILIISIYIIILFLAIFLIFFKPINFFKIKNDFSTTVLPGDEGKIYDSLKSGKNEYDNITVYPMVSFDNVKNLILDIRPKDSFYWNYKYTIYSGRKSLSQIGVLSFSDNVYNLKKYSSGNILVKSVTQNEKNTTVKTYTKGVENEKTFSGNTHSIFAEAGVPVVETFLDVADKENYTFTLADSDFGKLLLVTFKNTKGELSIIENYYISLDYGLVVRTESYENGVLVYLLETTLLSESE